MKFDWTNKVKPKFGYSEDSIGGKLERWMNAHGLESIGDRNFRERYRLPGKNGQPGEIRSASLELHPRDRAYRTLWTMDLTSDQLREFHAHEQKKMRFLFVFEAREFLKLPPKKYLMSEYAAKILETFTNEHRPEMERHPESGLLIPPYFPDDYEFDGMTYNQAWDLSVRRFSLPSLAENIDGDQKEFKKKKSSALGGF